MMLLLTFVETWYYVLFLTLLRWEILSLSALQQIYKSEFQKKVIKSPHNCIPINNYFPTWEFETIFAF